nr:ankyrin repeat domain-containing protein [Clostridium swellfunianum]
MSISSFKGSYVVFKSITNNKSIKLNKQYIKDAIDILKNDLRLYKDLKLTEKYFGTKYSPFIFKLLNLVELENLVEEDFIVLFFKKERSEYLINAIKEEDYEKCRELIIEGVDLDYTTGRYTPLDCAIANGNKEICELLIKNGAKVDSGNIALAITKGYKEICGILIKAGAKPSTTTLNYAIRSKDMKLFDYLLKNGAIPDKETLEEVVRLGNIEIFERTLPMVKDLHVDYLGRLLHYAVSSNNEIMCKCLIAKGANVNYEGANIFSSILSTASSSGNLDIVKMLIDAGANIEGFSNGSDSPIYAASSSGHLDIVKLLIGAGASIEGSSITTRPIAGAVSRGHLEVCKLLIENGACLDFCDDKNQSLLLIAIGTCNIELISYLLEMGVDVNSQDKYKHSALHDLFYKKKNKVEICKLLIDYGINVNLKNDNGQTPLFCFTTYYADEEICRLLINSGADVNIHDRFGKTPLMNILRLKNDEFYNKYNDQIYENIYNMLIEAGAKE